MTKAEISQTLSRKIYLIVFSLMALFYILSGVARYVTKPVFPGLNQGDLIANIALHQNFFGRELTVIDAESAAAFEDVPYLPILYPLLDLLGAVPPYISSILWVIINVASVTLVALLTLALLDSHGVLKFNRSNAFLVVTTLFLYKGVHIGLYAGQMGFLSIALLLLFLHFERRSTALSLLFLALSTYKPNIAFAGFLYLIISANWKSFFLAGVGATLLNAIIAIFYGGLPLISNRILSAVMGVGSIDINKFQLAGLSGRTDLAPFLSSFGLSDIAIKAVVGLTLLIFSLFFYRHRDRVGQSVLKAVAVILCLLCLYHREPDMLLLYTLAPSVFLIRERVRGFAILILLPFVFPIIRIAIWGVERFPDLAPLFNLIGTAYVPVLLTVLIILASLKRRGEEESL